MKESDQDLSEIMQTIGTNLVIINDNDLTVELKNKNVQIDLGGIGKGFALDKMAAILTQWDIDKALLHGGTSTILALKPPNGKKGWRVSISDPADHSRIIARLELTNKALSCSGIQKRGLHIFDPKTTEPVEDKLNAWAITSDGATADALSTAFMVMNLEQIEEYCKLYPDTLALIALPPDQTQSELTQFKKFGNWHQSQLVE